MKETQRTNVRYIGYQNGPKEASECDHLLVVALFTTPNLENIHLFVKKLINNNIFIFVLERFQYFYNFLFKNSL